MSCHFPEDVRKFVESTVWTFARTYAATWPHEYIVRSRVDADLFVMLVRHIRSNGYEGRFYRTSITYFDENGMVYWTMGTPIEETTIVNRCTKEQTYKYRLAHGTLPESTNANADHDASADAERREGKPGPSKRPGQARTV